MINRYADRLALRAFANARAGILGATFLVPALMLMPLAPVRAQDPQAKPSPKYIPPKECPPPEGFRAVLHMLDNDSPFLQMYPLAGLPMPKNMFVSFGVDMIPKCALERTYDDLSRFRTEWAGLSGLTSSQALPTPKLTALGSVTYRALKRWQWTHLLTYSKAPEYEYDGSAIPELKEMQSGLFQIAIDSGKKFIEGMNVYLNAFKGVENDAVEAKKRLDEDAKRPKPRAAKDIAKDQKTVADYERRFRENKDLLRMVKTVRNSFWSISRTHSKQPFSWPSSGNPAVTLAPMAAELVALAKKIERL